jgi:hypothetical protein
VFNALAAAPEGGKAEQHAGRRQAGYGNGSDYMRDEGTEIASLRSQ